jgi:hypothetical protein
MNQLIEIVKPAIKILKSSPTSLGSVTYYMVIFDEVIFSVHKHGSIDDWFQEYGYDVTEYIGEDNFNYPIYMLHCTDPENGETIISLVEKKPSTKQFSTNRTDCDSGVIQHCIAIEEAFDFVYIKSGFHYYMVWDNKRNNMPTSWDSMSNIYDGKYSFLSVPRIKFWSLYHSMLKIWNQQVARSN